MVTQVSPAPAQALVEALAAAPAEGDAVVRRVEALVQRVREQATKIKSADPDRVFGALAKADAELVEAQRALVQAQGRVELAERVQREASTVARGVAGIQRSAEDARRALEATVGEAVERLERRGHEDAADAVREALRGLLGGVS